MKHNTVSFPLSKFLQDFDVGFGEKEVPPNSLSFLKLYDIAVFPSQQKGLPGTMAASNEQMNHIHVGVVWLRFLNSENSKTLILE